MRTSTIKQTGCIHSIDRLNSSAMGNPRFALKVSLWNDDNTFERTTIETSPNSGIAYAIDQSMLCKSGGGSFEFTYHITAVRGTKILDGFESLNKRHEKELEASAQRWAEIDQKVSTVELDHQQNRFAWESRGYSATLTMLERRVANIRNALRSGDQS